MRRGGGSFTRTLWTVSSPPSEEKDFLVEKEIVNKCSLTVSFSALYKGFLPCWLRMAPWSLTFWLSYEQIRKAAGAKSWWSFQNIQILLRAWSMETGADRAFINHPGGIRVVSQELYFIGVNIERILPSWNWRWFNHSQILQLNLKIGNFKNHF